MEITKIIHLKYKQLGYTESFIRVYLETKFPWKSEFISYCGLPSRPLQFLFKIRDFFSLYGRKDLVFHCHYGSNAILFLWVAWLKIPLVVSFYGHDYSAFPHRFFGFGRLLLRLVFTFSSAVIAMTPFMKKKLMELGCPEGKIFQFHAPARVHNTLARVDVQRKKLLMIASFREKKNHEFMLKVMNILKDFGFSLTLVGDGPLREKIILETQRQNLSCIEFKNPFYDLKTLQVLLENHDMMVLPSKIAENGDCEGIPTVILEALQAGLPVISSDHAGILESLGEAVLIATILDPQSFASEILLAFSSHENLSILSKRAKDFYQRVYLQEIWIENLRKCYYFARSLSK